MPEPLFEQHRSHNVQSSLSLLLSIERQDDDETRGCVCAGGMCACSWPSCAPYYRPTYSLRPCVGWALVRAFLTAVVLVVVVCSGGVLIEVILEDRIVNPLPWKQ